MAVLRATALELDAACPPVGGSRLGGLGPAELRDYGAAGFVWRARELGDYRVLPDGRTVHCVLQAPPASQPFLTGQVLPLCAVLQGLEVVHAAAVAVGGGALAVTGPSGAGKSTVAAALVDAGADFLTDDVAAIEIAGGRALVHPGPERVKLRPDAAETLGGLAPAAAQAPGAVQFAMQAATAPVELRAVAVLIPASALAVHAVVTDPMLLLGSNFIPVLRRPERLRRLLDVCAAVATGARMLRVGVPPRADPRAVAAALREAIG